MTTSDTKREIPTVQSGDEMMVRFHENLMRNPEALEYVLGRGIRESVISDGRVGYCPPFSNHWATLLRGRIIVPIHDVSGHIIAFAGRIYEPARDMVIRAFYQDYEVAEAQRRIDKWDRGKWINESFAKRHHLFNLNAAKAWVRYRGYLVLVEGYFDSLVLAGRGLQNNAALCGVTLTEWHVPLVSRYCRKVVTILDGDAAGQNEEKMTQMEERLTAAGIELYVVLLPSGYDPDQFVIETSGPGLRKEIELAIEAGEHIIRLAAPAE